MREGVYSEQNEDDQKKNLAKEIRACILVSCVLDAEAWLHNLGELDVSYNAYIPFERLDYGYTTEFRIGVDLLLGALLSYIFMLIYASLVI